MLKYCVVGYAGPASCTITGLDNGTSYTFETVARLATWSTPVSAASAAITPAALPGAPTAVTAAAGNAQASVSWAAPLFTGGVPIASYTATAVEDPSKNCSTGNGATTCIVTGLSNGTSYTFTVTATNSAGTSPASSPSAAVVPTAPAATPGGAATPVPPPRPVIASLATRPPKQRGNTVTTMGTVPTGATSVMQVATKSGRAATAFGFAKGESARVTTRCSIRRTGRTRTFTCRARLGAGNWTLTTEAKAGSVVVAESVRRIRVKAPALSTRR
jgi:predicted phage tail protein